MNSYIESTYAAYTLVSVAMTIWVARTLHRNGRIFLVDAFHGNEKLADSVNHLLVVGFYLVNIGFIALHLRTEEKIPTFRNAIEFFSERVGVVLLVLGAMHFANIIVFSKMRARARLMSEPPPIPPSERIAPIM